MERTILEKTSPTGMARILTEELLKDGMKHSKSEIVNYIQAVCLEHGCDISTSAIYNGINYVVDTLGCRVGRGLYQLPLAESNTPQVEEVLNACRSFSNTLRAIVAKIDVVNADDKHTELLKLMREFYQDTQGWVNIIEPFLEKKGAN